MTKLQIEVQEMFARAHAEADRSHAETARRHERDRFHADLSGVEACQV